MMANFCVLAWFLLVAGALVSASRGVLTPAAMVIYSLLALGLVFALMLWAVVANGREIQTEKLSAAARGQI